MKTEIFPREIGRKIGEAEEIRHASDYDDFYIASREEAERQVSVADEFIKLIEKYCMLQLEADENNGAISDIHAKLQKGYEDIEAGNVQNAANAFERFRESH